MTGCTYKEDGKAIRGECGKKVRYKWDTEKKERNYFVCHHEPMVI